MKKLILLSGVLLILTGCSSQSEDGASSGVSKVKSFFGADKPAKTVVINEHTWAVETVTTPEAQEKGLSDRESMPADNGMYFVFNDTTDRTFWMKNMKFALDIVWIKDDEVIKVDYDVMPEGANPANFYYSKEAVNRVLEVNNGDAMKYDIKVGDKVKYND